MTKTNEYLMELGLQNSTRGMSIALKSVVGALSDRRETIMEGTLSAEEKADEIDNLLAFAVENMLAIAGDKESAKAIAEYKLTAGRDDSSNYEKRREKG